MKSKLSRLELATFCSQMSLTLNAGISSLESLSMIKDSSTDKKDIELLNVLIESMQMGDNLFEALNKTNMFPTYMIQMTRLGEETGTLAEVMIKLKSYYEREDSIYKSIISAITYPGIMLGIMVIIVLVMLIKVMPIFNQVYNQLGSDMSGLSKTLLNMGLVLKNYAYVFISILIVIAAFFIYIIKVPSGRVFLNKIGNKISFIRNLQEKVATSRFISGLSMTVKCGLSTQNGFELLNRLSTASSFRNKLFKYEKLINNGVDMATSLKDSGILSGAYYRIASIGVKTGATDQALDNIAMLCAEEIDDKASKIIAIIEPTLIVILSVIIGIILLSIMLPLLSIMSSL